LQEYFSFPQRFRFFEVAGLGPTVKQALTNEIELVILFGRADATLENAVDRSNFALFCTPAINLFPKRADRINITEGTHEHHVVVDRTKPLDFETYEVSRVVGHGVGSEGEQRFLPFYAAYSGDEQGQHSAYFTVRREPRRVSASEKRRGSRSSYIGSETFLSLVDPMQAPYAGDLRQLSVEVLCTNRDLILLPQTTIDFSLEVAAPVLTVRAISGPSRPYTPIADGAACWKAISLLSLNYLSLVNSTPQEGAKALRDLLGLCAVGAADGAAGRQIQGIRSVAVERVVRRLHEPGPLAFCRGLQINLLVDDMAFDGGTAYLLGAVLDRFFSRHVSINSFTETVLKSERLGEISRWTPQWGIRPTL
jgi:type VI secretion system protein ImpG